MRSVVFFLLFNVLGGFAFAQEPPQFFSLDGRLYDTSTPANPLADATVTMLVQVLNPAKSCVLYEEEQTLNTLVSDGYFNIRVGSPTAGPDSAKRSANDSGNSLRVAFQNKNQVINGKTAGGAACTYTPAAGDERHFRFIVTPASTGVTATLSPDMTIDSVPQAVIAETVQGLGPQDFIQVNANVTQAKADSLFGGSYAGLTSLLGGTSSLYLQNDPEGTVIPVRATDPAGPSEGQIWFDSATNQVKYYDGGAVQALGTSGGDPTKLPLAGGTMTGNINMDGHQILATGHVTMSPLSTITIGTYNTVDQGTLTGAMNASNKGAMWFNSDTNKMMYWDGTAPQVVADMATAGGDITAVNSGAGLTGGFTTGAGTLAVDIGTAAGQLFTIDQVPNCAANQKLQMSLGPAYNWSCAADNDSGGDITAVNTNAGSGLSGGAATGAATLSVVVDDSTIEVNGTNQLRVKDSGITNIKIVDMAISKLTSAVGQYFTYQPNGAQCANNQVLKWDDGNDRWDCANDIDTNTDAVSTVFGRAGAVVSQNGDYSASQVTNTAAGNIAAVTTQAAINELDSEKVAKSGDTMSGDLNMGGNDLLALGNMTMNALSRINVGRFTNAEQATLVGGLGAGDDGAVWFNSDTNKLMVWDGAAPQELSDAASAGGDITAVNTNAPLTGGAVSGAITLSLAYDNSSIGLNGSNQVEVKDGGIINAKIADVSVDKITSAATKYFTYMPNGAQCANNQVLKWDDSNDRWICANDVDTDTNTDAVSTVFGRAGAVVSQNGDYTASQVTNVAAGNIAGVTLQAAVNELDTEKVNKADVPQCPAGQKLQMGAGPVYPWSCVSEATSTLLADADNDTKIQVEEAADEDKIRFDTANNQRMIIDETGKIGIGTATPASLLEVAGVIHSTSGGFKFPDGTTQTTASGGGAFKAAHIAQTISFPNGWTFTVGFAAPSYDTGNFWNAGAPTRYTIPAGVTYVRLIGTLSFSTASTSNRIGIRKNGATLVSTTTGSNVASSGDYSMVAVTPIISVIAGDYFEVEAYQSSGGNLNGDIRFAIEAVSGTTVASSGSGTLNYIPLWTSTSALGDSPLAVSGGNVGIGTTTPGEKLEVSGKVKATELCIGADCRAAWPAGAGGDITDVTTGGSSGLTGGVATGNANISVVTDASTIEINGSNQLQVKDAGITDAKIVGMSVDKITSAASKYFTYQPNGAQCANNQVLKWDDGNDRWVCANDTDTNTDAVSTVFGRAGAVASQNGDYTAAQITNTPAGAIASVTAQAAIDELDLEKVGKADVPQCPAGQKLQMGAGPAYPWSCVNEAVGILLADADNDSKIQVEEAADEDKIRFDTANNERMIIDDTGKVGIGTSSPVQLLSVSKNQNAETGLYITNTDAGVAASSTMLMGVGSGGQYGFMSYYNSGYTPNGVLVPRRTVVGGSDTGGLTLLANNAAGYITMVTGGLGGGNERLRIDASGSVGIGTTTPNASSLMDVSSTTKGFLPPRMTTAQRNGIGSPATGLIIFNTTTDQLEMRTSTGWTTVGATSGPYLRLVYTTGTVTRANVIPFNIVAEAGGGASYSADRFTAVTPGVYSVSISGYSAGGAFNLLSIRKNGATIADGRGAAFDAVKPGGAAVTAITYLSAGDYIDFYYNHDSGGVPLGGAVAGIALVGGGGQVGGGGNDNLGNHTATQNVILGANWLSGDGNNEGLRIDSNGNIGIGASTPNELLTVEGVTSLRETAAPTQTANYGKLYVKSGDSKLYFMNDSGVEVDLTADANTDAVSTVFGRAGAVVSQNGDYTASQVTNVAAGNIAAVTVQTAVNELDAEKVNKADVPQCSAGQKLQMGAGPVYPWTCVSEAVGVLIADADNDTKVQVEESADEDKIRFDTANNQRMIIDETGKVGIGITNPSTALDVTGDVMLSGTLNVGRGASYLQYEKGVNDRMLSFINSSSSGSGGWDFFASDASFNTSRLRIQNNGYVGIGTASPASKTHIFNGASGGTPYAPTQSTDLTIEDDDRAIIQFLSPSTADAQGFFFGTEVSNIGAQFAYAPNTKDFTWYNGEYMIMKGTTGNVGIGTTTPGQKLTVAGTIESTSGGIKFPDGTVQTTSAIGGTNNTMFSGFPDAIKCHVGGTDTYVTLWIYFTESTTNRVGYRYIQNTNGDTTMTFNYTTGAYVNHVGMTGYDCVTNTWSLAQLYANGRAFNFAKGPVGQWLQNGSDNYYNAGKVGIGTSTPIHKFQIDVGASSNYYSGFTANRTDYSMMNLNNSSLASMAAGSDWALGISGSAGSLAAAGAFVVHQHGLGPRITVSPAGNVGIGTTNPTYKLQIAGGDVLVEGTAGAYTSVLSGTGDTYIRGGAAASKIVIGDQNTGTVEMTGPGNKIISGNVGIGTAGPTEKLHVAGGIKASGTTATHTANSTAIDYIGAGNRLLAWGPTAATYNPFFVVQMTSDGSGSRIPLYIDTSGNVGVATSSPATKFNVGSGDLQVEAGQGRFKGWYTGSANTGRAVEVGVSAGLGYVINYDRTAGTYAPMWLNSTVYVEGNNGNVGLGVNPGSTKLRVAHTGSVWAGYFDGSMYGLFGQGYGGGTGVHGYNSSYVTSGYLATSNIGVQGVSGAGQGGWGGHFTGDYGAYALNHAGYYAQLANSSWGIYSNGNANMSDYYIAATGVWASSFSDERLKKSIKPLKDEYGLSAVLQLRPVTYRWKDKEQDKSEGEKVGFIAQEVEKLIPTLVLDGKMDKTIKTEKGEEKIIKPKAFFAENLTAPIVKAIQEFYAKWLADSSALHKELQDKEARIRRLEEENRAKDRELATIKEAICETNPKAKICGK